MSQLQWALMLFKGLKFHETQGIHWEGRGFNFLQQFWGSQKDIRMNRGGSVHVLSTLRCLVKPMALPCRLAYGRNTWKIKPQTCSLGWCSGNLTFGKAENQKEKNSHFGRCQIRYCQFWQCLLVTPECLSKYLLKADLSDSSRQSRPLRFRIVTFYFESVWCWFLMAFNLMCDKVNAVTAHCKLSSSPTLI